MNSSDVPNNPPCTAIQNRRWKKIGEWNEFWYFTELCFLALQNNPVTKTFLLQGMDAISLNSEWYYEEEKFRDWDSGLIKATQQTVDFYRELITSIQYRLDQAEKRFSIIKDNPEMDREIFQLYTDAFMDVWYVFLADIGKHLDQSVDLMLQKEGFTKKEREAISQYYLAVHTPLGYQHEQENLKMLFQKFSATVNLSNISIDHLPAELLALLDEHRQVYGWIATSDIDTEPPPLAEYLQRVKDVAGTVLREKDVQLPGELVFKMTNTAKTLLEALHELVTIDNLAADLFGKMNFHFQSRLSQEHGVSFRDISWYTWTELRQLVSNRKTLNSDVIATRKGYRVMICIDGKIEEKYGEQVIEKIRSLVSHITAQEVSSFSGVKASLGYAEGIAKIVKTVQDMEKVNQGDIIVAPTTRPDLMPALRRCAAIVTDTGGITSHAAIVSRELRVPCIVGTEIATDVLKDGDYIIVNANEGIITKKE